jgi:hypothetical protein
MECMRQRAFVKVARRRGDAATREAVAERASVCGPDHVEAEPCAPAQARGCALNRDESARARALDRLAGWREGERTGGVGDWASTGVSPRFIQSATE